MKQPILETKRLILREYNLDDARSVVPIWNKKSVMKWIHGIPFPCSLKEAKKILRENEKGAYYFPIIIKKDKKLIGSIWFRHLEPITDYKIAELGYLLDDKYWKKGYASEAVGCLIKWGFERLKLRKIIANVNNKNPNSAKVLKKYGFILEGKRKKQIKIRFSNIWCDEEEYGLLKEDWKKNLPKLKKHLKDKIKKLKQEEKKK